MSVPGAVDYSYLITNTGNVTLTGIALKDTNTDSAPVCLETTLVPAGTTTCSAVHTVTQAEWTWVGLSTTASTRAPTRGPWRATR